MGCGSPPQFHWLKINSAKQTQNAEFTGQRSIIVKMPAANTHSVLNFRHFKSHIWWKPWNSLQQTCDIHHSKVWVQLVPFGPSRYICGHSLFKRQQQNSTQRGAVPAWWRSCCHSYVETPPPMCAALCPHSSCHTSCHSSSADDTHNL